MILVPGQWEYELVEMKSPGSIWNPDPGAGVYLSAASEGREGRTGYVEETAGAYYAARMGVLEHLDDRGRQAKALVLRHVSDDYWGPVGVWQVREAVRNAFEGEHGTAETFGEAVRGVADHLRSRSVASDENRRWRPDYRRTSATSSTPGERDGSEEQRSSRPIRFSPVVEWVGAWFPQFPRSAASPPVLNS